MKEFQSKEDIEDYFTINVVAKCMVSLKLFSLCFLLLRANKFDKTIHIMLPSFLRDCLAFP